jgi:hypothetical protein
MRNIGDRVQHTWRITGKTVTGTVVEQTTKEGETAWRIQFDTEQQILTGDAGSEIIVKQSDITDWPVIV